jgi:hypothetical protein
MAVSFIGEGEIHRPVTSHRQTLSHNVVLNTPIFFVFNAIFSNISAISWRPVLVVEEARVPGENHRPWASNW